MLPMDERLQTLLTLQDHDARMLACEKELERIPVERKNLEEQQIRLEQILETAVARSKEIEVEKNELELQIKAKEEQIAKYKTQQMQTRKNEEYAALSNEIEAARKVIEGLEDRELELLEEADRMVPVKKTAEEEFQAGKAKLELRVKGMEEKAENLRKEADSQREARKAVAATADPDQFAIYERLFRSKGASAIVPLDADVCGGCHMKVPSQIVVDVKAGKELVHCPLCGRILYPGA